MELVPEGKMVERMKGEGKKREETGMELLWTICAS